MPQTLGAVLALLLLVGPGFALAVIRERYLPGGDQSGFREVSAATLVGLLISAVTFAVLAFVGSRFEGIFPNPQDWILGGSRYAASHLSEIASFVVAWGVSAIGLGAVIGWLVYRKRSGRIAPGTDTWFEMFRGRVAPKQAVPMLRVCLTSGYEYVGKLAFYDVGAPLGDRNLVLEPPLKFRPNQQAALAPLPEGGAWSRVIVPAPTIDSVWVRFVPRD